MRRRSRTTASLVAIATYTSIRLVRRPVSASAVRVPVGSTDRSSGAPACVNTSVDWFDHTCGERYASPSGETRTYERNASAIVTITPAATSAPCRPRTCKYSLRSIAPTTPSDGSDGICSDPQPSVVRRLH